MHIIASREYPKNARTDVGGDVRGGEEDERHGQPRAHRHVHAVRLELGLMCGWAGDQGRQNHQVRVGGV